MVEENTGAIIATIIGGVSALIIALLKFFGNKSLQKRLDGAKDQIKTLKKERNGLLIENYEHGSKIHSMKQAFDIGYNQLRTDFKNEPQKMRLWDNIKETFDGD